jgi:hypothetical protein
LVAKAGKVTVANDRCQHGYAQRRAFILNKQRAGTVCPAYLLPYSRQNLSTSPNGFKICKVPIPWTFAFGLDSREFSTPHEFQGATVKVDCVAFSRLDISEDVDEIVGKLEHPLEFLLF